MVNVCVFGATGNIGRDLVPHLVKESAVEKIIVVTNRPDEVIAHQKIEVIRGDYCNDKLTVMAALDGCSRLFVILPQSLKPQDMIERGKFVAKCAQEANVEYMVRISSLGIDNKSVKYVCSQGPLGDAHIAVESYCEEIGQKCISLRPTSFFSNLGFNVEEMKKDSRISTPLGTTARVNWVSCKDIATVAAKVLVAENCDAFGKVLDITGPRENTLGGEEMADCLSAIFGKHIEYKEVGIPPVADYAGLWTFLRSGGFDCQSTTVEKVTGREGVKFSDISVDIL